MVDALLDSSATELIVSSEFVKKNKFKKKLERQIYVRNVNSIFNHKGLMEHMVEIELFYRGHKERTEIDMIGEQKWSVILEILWLVCYNPEIDWKTRKVKMMRYSDECESSEK